MLGNIYSYGKHIQLITVTNKRKIIFLSIIFFMPGAELILFNGIQFIILNILYLLLI